MTTRYRIALIACLGIALGLWSYATQKGGSFLDTPIAGVCVLLLIFATGCLVKRWWMLLAIMGPLAVLGYLEVSGFESTGDDWAREPLLSPPGIFVLVYLSFLMFFAVALGKGLQAIHGQWRERRQDSEG